MLNMLNIQYFMMLEKERNFSRAARKLYISQQSLSNHIKTLESELDTKLFERTTPLRLTDTGEILLHYCQTMSTEYTQFINKFNDAKQNRMGHLRLGISFTRGRIILPRLLPEYKKNYPDINVSIIEGNSHELTEALMDRKIDIMIGEFNNTEDDIAITNLMNDEILLLCPDILIPDSNNADANFLSIENLQSLPYLLCKSGNTARTIADEIFHKNKIIPNIVIEAENMETLYEMCIAGMGVTFYPKSFLENHLNNIKKEQLHIIQLPYSFVSYPIKIAYSKTSYLSQAAIDFINSALKTYSTDTKNN